MRPPKYTFQTPKNASTSVELIYIELGDRIRDYRKRARITQECLAKNVGISRASLANIELGRQRIMLHLLNVFACHLGIKPQELVRGLWH